MQVKGSTVTTPFLTVLSKHQSGATPFDRPSALATDASNATTLFVH